MYTNNPVVHISSICVFPAKAFGFLVAHSQSEVIVSQVIPLRISPLLSRRSVRIDGRKCSLLSLWPRDCEHVVLIESNGSSLPDVTFFLFEGKPGLDSRKRGLYAFSPVVAPCFPFFTMPLSRWRITCFRYYPQPPSRAPPPYLVLLVKN